MIPALPWRLSLAKSVAPFIPWALLSLRPRYFRSRSTGCSPVVPRVSRLSPIPSLSFARFARFRFTFSPACAGVCRVSGLALLASLFGTNKQYSTRVKTRFRGVSSDELPIECAVCRRGESRMPKLIEAPTVIEAVGNKLFSLRCSHRRHCLAGGWPVRPSDTRAAVHPSTATGRRCRSRLRSASKGFLLYAGGS